MWDLEIVTYPNGETYVREFDKLGNVYAVIRDTLDMNKLADDRVREIKVSPRY